MFKEFTVTLYKVMYNKQLKRYPSPTRIACLTTALFFGFLILDGIVIKEIITHTRVNLHAGKTTAIIYFSIVSFITYLMLFKIFKVEPASDFGYSISEETTKKIWIIYILNIVLCLLLPVIRKFIFKL